MYLLVLKVFVWMQYMCLDNGGSDLRNLIGQLQVSKCGRNLERDLIACMYVHVYVSNCYVAR